MDSFDKLKEQWSSFVNNFSVEAFWDTVKKHAKTDGRAGSYRKKESLDRGLTPI